MSYAGLTLTIILMVNVFIFLAGDPDVNSPMLGLLKGIVSGNYEINFTAIFNLRSLAIITTVALISLGLSTAMSPASALTGSQGTYHILTVLGIGIFVSLCMLPNIGAMAIPEPIASLIQIFLGFLMVMSIIGFLRGE